MSGEEGSEGLLVGATKRTRKQMQPKEYVSELTEREHARARITVRSDGMGCEHRGIKDLFQVGGVEKQAVSWYSVPGKILHNNFCRDCGIPVASIDKTMCLPICKTYFFASQVGMNDVEACRLVMCHDCLMKIRNKLEEEKTLQGGRHSNRRGTRK